MSHDRCAWMAGIRKVGSLWPSEPDAHPMDFGVFMKTTRGYSEKDVWVVKDNVAIAKIKIWDVCVYLTKSKTNCSPSYCIKC